MAEYGFSAEADEDIQQIYIYSVAQFGSRQADTYADQLLRSVQVAANFPAIGRPYQTRRGAILQRYAIGRHVIFYQLTGSGILVVRVLHQMMDFDRHLDG